MTVYIYSLSDAIPFVAVVLRRDELLRRLLWLQQ